MGLKEGIDSDLNSFVDPLLNDPSSFCPMTHLTELLFPVPGSSLLCAHHSQSLFTHVEQRKISDKKGVFGATKG